MFRHVGHATELSINAAVTRFTKTCFSVVFKYLLSDMLACTRIHAIRMSRGVMISTDFFTQAYRQNRLNEMNIKMLINRRMQCLKVYFFKIVIELFNTKSFIEKILVKEYK